MSHGKLRSDNECENCGYTVEVAYCTKCGQHNVETRQTFPKLVGHFAEDLTHYDTAFWRSLKHLLFRPGRLTRIYLEGKRQQYVPPVKLYIFISFITFLIIGLMPKSENESEIAKSGNIEIETGVPQKNDTIHWVNKPYTSFEEAKKDYMDDKISFLAYHMLEASFHIRDNEIGKEEIKYAILHTVPKGIFLYMPVFSFWIWLVHGKKRWYFFDHGIFTLHYFSFLLLSFTIFFIIGRVLSWIIQDEGVLGTVTFCFATLLIGYMIFYFFRSHRRMYGESRLVSRLKSILLFFINMWCLVWLILGILYYALKSTH